MTVALVLAVLDLLFSLGLRTAAAAENAAVVTQLKEALSEYPKKNPLETWQTKLFEDEVLPQYQRFIKDYRPGPQGLQVEVDQDSLRKYLQFYGPKTLKARDYKVYVWLVIDPACPACGKAAGELKSLISARLEHRGLAPVWMDAPGTAARGFEDKCIDFARGRQGAGALVVQAIRAPQDDEDAAHADELRYWVATTVAIRELGTKSSGHIELLANDSIESAAARLLTDAFTEMGGRVQNAVAASVLGSSNGVVLEVSQFKDYAMYQDILNKLSSGLKDAHSIEEKRLTRGHVWLSVQTSRAAADVRRQVDELGLRNFVEVKQ